MYLGLVHMHANKFENGPKQLVMVSLRPIIGNIKSDYG